MFGGSFLSVSGGPIVQALEDPSDLQLSGHGICAGTAVCVIALMLLRLLLRALLARFGPRCLGKAHQGPVTLVC